MRLIAKLIENLQNLKAPLPAIKFCPGMPKVPLPMKPAVLQSLKTLKPSPQRRFIERYASHAMITQRMTGIPASVTLAQAALESGWGKHAPGNNFFGIKGNGPAGTQLLWTKEFRNGQFVRVRAPFRKYDNPLQSFLDHAQVIARGKYLKHAMNHTNSPRDFVQALQSGRKKYATDPRYTEKVMNLIHIYNLERFDRLYTPGS